jgi:hypothetical protein
LFGSFALCNRQNDSTNQNRFKISETEPTQKKWGSFSVVPSSKTTSFFRCYSKREMEEYDDLVPEPNANGEVDMTHQGWKVLDQIVWKMGLKIIILNVAFNQIEHIPEQIGDLILMKDLNISNNQISVS